MVVGEANINNIMGGIENTGTVRLHNHKRKLKQRFDIIKKLGQGTYGKVQLGINKETGQEVAIKTIKKSKIETEADLIRIRREIQIMSSVQHPNIIHIYEVFENREKMVLVMEYAAGGELYDYLYERKMLDENEARRIFRQISTACYYCHKHKICHRDLKLENILLDENKNAKIADFGLSNVFDDQRLLSTFCGSPLYASPEIVNGTPYHGPEVDCWSLGVLLYTLVYGAMPFDGSNFKRLVKQISQGDYFEPKKPSPASPLILEMLTVNPKNRASIEKICAHWWVNEGYNESCLDISEELANQTPVRLDVLLSLNPPPAQIESEKLVLTGEVPEEEIKAEPVAPTRSQSVGSLMEVSNPAERRIQDMIVQEFNSTPKRKLETTVSTDHANLGADGKRKDKIVKENTIADISIHNNEESVQDVKMTDVNSVEENPNIEVKEVLQTEILEPSLQGAACAEIMEEAKKNGSKKTVKSIKKTMSTSLNTTVLEEINENPSQENLFNNGTGEKNKENIAVQENLKVESNVVKVEEAKTPVKKKVIKKKVLGDKNEVAKPKVSEPDKKLVVEEKKDPETPTKPIERRQSRIFEQAEKFQNLIISSDSKAHLTEKPKKLIIPGVSVGGFKKEFERKASLTSTSPPKLKPTASKKLVIDDKQTSIDIDSNPEDKPLPSTPKQEEQVMENKEIKEQKTEIKSEGTTNAEESKPAGSLDEDQKVKLRNAVSIISNALDKEGARKSKSRPCMGRKPPVPFGVSGRSASGSISMNPILAPTDIKRFIKLPSPSEDNRQSLLHNSQPQQAQYRPEPMEPINQTSSAEITLKSATLPRRKSAKAEIQLDYPKPKPVTMEFKTEMAHKVQAPPALSTQRSEVLFPANSPPHNVGFRSASVEPEAKSYKERIIPIAFERKGEEPLQSPPTKPPVPRSFQSQKSTTSQRSNSLSRQSTQESDSEPGSGDPIKKSPREYIIPIAVEGGGYVTPRAGSLEPSETSSTVTNSSRKTTTSKFGRPRRMMSLFDRDGSEDESPFSTLHRHSSFGRQDSDTEGDSRKDSFHMHRLRSSRPRKSNLEHNDSLSSGEDDDDEDGFEFLTAENLFSTLLSRVRDLTQRINVDDGRPGFPNSRLLSHFDHGTSFFNRRDPLSSSRNSPLGRQFSRERSLQGNSSSSIPWRRSVSRDLASDIDSVFNETNKTPSRTASLPRGVANFLPINEDFNTKWTTRGLNSSTSRDSDRKENLNLSDLNLKKLKLTEEDALALSYLTPGLSRRIQKQLFASLPPSEARKISRTLSMRNEGENDREQQPSMQRRSVEHISSTLPRKLSFDKSSSTLHNLTDINRNKTNTEEKGYLPKTSLNPRNYRASSLREPVDYKPKLHTYSLRSPDSSLSEISSLRDDSYRSEIETKPTRKVSRFLRPDFFDTPKEEVVSTPKDAVSKEKKEREMETQKVLKEIRDKRIKNRISMRRERSLSREQSEQVPDEIVRIIRKDEPMGIKRKIEDRNVLDVRKSMDESSRFSNDKGKFAIDNGLDSIKKLGDRKNIVEESIKKIETMKSSIEEDDGSKRLVSDSKVNAKKEIKVSEKKYVEMKKIDGVKTNGANSKLIGDTAVVTHDNNGNEKTIKCKELVDALTGKDGENTINDSKSPDLSAKLYPEKNLKNVSENIKNIETVMSKEGVMKKDRISKLIRPKSYPTENGMKIVPKQKSTETETTDMKIDVKTVKSQLEGNVSGEGKDVKQKITKLKKVATAKAKDSAEPKPKNKFLQSIEKKFEKLRTFNNDDKIKEEKKSGVESAIKRLREQSVPRNMNHITESTLIKRAVSVEDFSNVKNKALQPSRKSVTKILGLFKKYEDKEKSEEVEVIPQLTHINESNIPYAVKAKSPDRPKSLLIDKKRTNGSSSDNTINAEKKTSRLPFRRSLNLETKNSNNNNEERKNLKLELSNINQPNDINRNSYTTDESSTLLSPCDESLSCDSWSVCSDLHHTQDLVSPLSPNSNTYSGDENESVIDRIRRKSFYTRFNEKKKPRKTSLVGNYKDLDLYKDYNQKTIKYKPTPDYGSYRKSGYSSSGEGEREYRSYVRSKSLVNDYVNVPNQTCNRYQTYNPRRSNIASLYTSMSDDSPLDDTVSTGTCRKYSYSPNTSRLGSLNRGSRSPSSDFQYIPQAHTSTSEHSSISSPSETSRPVTEHAV